MTSREQLIAKMAAFDEAHRGLKDRLRGAPEDTVRGALRPILDEYDQTLSPTEFELWTLEVVDPDWASKDPQRLATLMRLLEEEAAAALEPG